MYYVISIYLRVYQTHAEFSLSTISVLVYSCVVSGDVLVMTALPKVVTNTSQHSNDNKIDMQ